MKRLFTVLVLSFVAFASIAQWTLQNTAFTSTSRGIKFISVVDSNTVWATAYDGANTANNIQEFTKTTNGGTSWTPYVVGGYTGYGLSMICAVDNNNAWIPAYNASTGGGVILHTSDGGTTWNPQTTASFAAPNGFPNVVHFWNADTGFCMGDPNEGYFELYTTEDGGTTWTRVPSGNIPAPVSGEYGVTGYYSVVGSTIWFSTNKSHILKSSDYGHTWSLITVPIATDNQFAVKFRSLNDGIIRMNTTPYSAYITHDGGATWNIISFYGNWYNNDYCHVPGTASTWVSVGADATTPFMGISYSTDDGANWTDFTSMDTTQHLAVAFADHKTGWSGSFHNYATDGIFKHYGSTFVLDTCSTFYAAFTLSKDTVFLTSTAEVIFTDASSPAATDWAWDFGDGASASTQNPSHTYTSTGTYTVQLIAHHGVCVDTSTATVVVLVGSAIDEQNYSLTLYPNPAADAVYINGLPSGEYLAEWISTDGRVIESVRCNETTILNTENIENGLYILRFSNESINIRKPLVIRHN
ncbi:MAG: PKD domain-containing protein [Bacteroidales bacterium]|jgi:photosystem II stability/assembly factor-like uncharacterized protein|nr:PKD domain-containing protein [Bacteroidales bacterium]